jgi:hypothetical protein
MINITGDAWLDTALVVVACLLAAMLLFMGVGALLRSGRKRR